MKIIENPLVLTYNYIIYTSSSVAGRCLLVRSEMSPRGDGIGARGRRRRPRVQQHARNAASNVPTNFHGDWRTLEHI